MSRDDWVLLVVAAGDQPLTPVQLQKSLFLIKEANLPELPEDFYDFAPYHFGPFDPTVYDDANMLHGEGFVVRHKSAVGSWVDTSITGRGRVKADALAGELSPPTISFVREIVNWAQQLSFRQLVEAIYTKYPEYRANSVFQS